MNTIIITNVMTVITIKIKLLIIIIILYNTIIITNTKHFSLKYRDKHALNQ